MYNLLEKLRAGEPFTDSDREYNNKALVSTLKQIHDELDAAVLDAYGCPQTITNEQILENLVAIRDLLHTSSGEWRQHHTEKTSYYD